MWDRMLKPLSENYLPPLFTPKLLNYLEDLNTRKQLIIDRHKKDFGTETPIIVLLRQILNYTDIKFLSYHYDNDIDRYVNALYPVINDIERIFDPVTTGLTKKDHFIFNKRQQEVIIPVRPLSPFTSYPIDKNWHGWKKVRSVRLIDLDSNELTYNLHQSKILFKKDSPTFSIFTIDVILLIMQYMHYYKSLKDDGFELLFIQQSFLHRHVILPIINDLQDIWLRNRYSTIIETPDPAIFKKDNELNIFNGIYGYIGLQYQESMNQILKLTKRVSSGTTVPDKLLASLPLSYNYLPDYYQSLKNNCDIPYLRQTLYTRFLRDFPYLKLVHYAYKLNPNYVGYKNYQRALNRSMDLISKARFYETIINKNIKDNIKLKLNEMTSWVT